MTMMGMLCDWSSYLTNAIKGNRKTDFKRSADTEESSAEEIGGKVRRGGIKINCRKAEPSTPYRELLCKLPGLFFRLHRSKSLEKITSEIYTGTSDTVY